MKTTFPDFAPISIDDKNFFEAFTHLFPNYSDFNFVSIFSWDINETASYSILNDNIVLRLEDYMTRDHLYTFIGTNKADETIRTIISHVNKDGAHPELFLIPESVVKAIKKPEEFVITEDHDNHDYILSVPTLVEFKTNDFRGKKNLHNRFVRAYGEHTVTKEIDLSDPEVQESINKVNNEWGSSRNKTLAEIESELGAIKRNLKHSEHLGAKAYGLYVADELVGYIIYEILPNKMIMNHFTKANIDYVGVFEYLDHTFAKHLSKQDIEFINYEQDLGIEGLRKSKLSHHPVDFLRKYRVKLA